MFRINIGESERGAPFHSLHLRDVQHNSLSYTLCSVTVHRYLDPAHVADMGLTQSTPAPTIDAGQPAPAVGDDPASAPPAPAARPTSPPHPSRSSLNPASTRPRRTGFSYFLPISTPDLQHSHLNPTLNDIRKTAVLLSTKLPAELVTRILDQAEYWAGCRTLIQKDLVVAAGTPSPRHAQVQWKTGQERGDLAGLQDGPEGEVWYLASEPLGCDETAAAGAPADEDEGTRARDGVRPKCWLRNMVIETLSKDQGWSSAVRTNPTLYGGLSSSLSRFVCRHSHMS